MFTYEMTIVNEDNCKKIIYSTGNSFIDAVKNMRREHGYGWVVNEYRLISSSY